ncbi:hypothetical protein [Streptomyces sp. NPDC048527]|uniref:hypothetical protein n=1 Tax=Streptomyces sp. NPDC048527 TaxID=3365568 RepID=UPI00371AFF47
MDARPRHTVPSQGRYGGARVRAWQKLRNNRFGEWLREILPWREDPLAPAPLRAVPLDEALWNVSAPSNWRNPHCRHRGSLVVYRPLPLPVTLRSPLQGIQLARCAFCEGWLYRRVWMPWPGDDSGNYPDIRPDLAHHLRQRIVSRSAEQLLNDSEVRRWEWALAKLADNAPSVGRGWRPARDHVAFMVDGAIREWDRASGF